MDPEPPPRPADSTEQQHRFFDSREKYLLFVTSCDEKRAIARRVGEEFGRLRPAPPALGVFDAGTGDGSVLASVLRELHQRHPSVPFLVVGKEIGFEDLRLTLSRLPDRLAEHPRMVVVLTNMRYREAPVLRPEQPERLRWREVALAGGTAFEFDAQLRRLGPRLQRWWRVTAGAKSGNPVYERPTVLVVYRQDRRFALDAVIPRRAGPAPRYDLVLAAQPYRARAPQAAKVRHVLEPLARGLAPGGRMLVVQSTGHDPGMTLVHRVWPDEAPFATPGPMLAAALGERLGPGFAVDTERQSLFRYSLQLAPGELDGPISNAALMAAWNAAVYVAQVDETQVREAMTRGVHLPATREILSRHRGLWFINEAFVVSRTAAQAAGEAW